MVRPGKTLFYKPGENSAETTMNETDAVLKRISKLIEARNWTALRDLTRNRPSADVTALMQALEKSERVLLFRALPREVASTVFAHLEPLVLDGLIRDLTDEETRRLLADLRPDDRTELLSEMPGQATQRLVNLLSPEDLRETRWLLGYPEESVGRLMTPDYVAVRPDWSVAHALEHIRKRGRDSETINIVYVTDASWKLLDALELRKFILADPAAHVSGLMDYSFEALPAFEDREKAVELIQRYDLVALPVVDSEGVLLGIVTVDDVMDVAQEEVTEDFQKTAAVSPLRLSYGESGIWHLYGRRIIWLAALLGLNLASAGVIALYESTLASAITLAFFIPLLMGSGGNVGTQSATLIVRAIAVGDVSADRWLWTAGRELAVGLVLGLTLGLLGWSLGLVKGGKEIAWVVGAAMVAIVIVANLIGALVPFLLLKLRIDPAVASSPLIASISDVTCLTIYFTLADGFLGVV
jgi:magnesium transporter